MYFWIFVSLVVIQRLVELNIAKRNERKLLEKGAAEIDKNGYRFIVLMHTAFFVSIMFEKNLFDTNLNANWIYIIIIFAAAQLLRYWAISSLGIYWNTKIIVLKGSPLVKKGPYKYLKHPNYVSVAVELAAIPLMFSCYLTAIVFSVLNLFVLQRRIRIEEKALGI